MSRLRLSVEDLERCWLPQSAIDLIEVIGTVATLTLMQRYGGITLALPRSIGADHDLSRLIGHDAARKLVEHWGGDRVYIPKADNAVRCVRDQEMIRRYDAGDRPQELALEYKITDRHFWRVMKKPMLVPGQRPPPKDDRQLSMLDD
ncbi:MAG: hypothetical protein HQL79_07570 [Magnetococcales bacterium]|nr:hypothetical protein [Magnetococcales bacterium]